MIYMVFAEDIRRAILAIADQRGPGNLFYSSEVARLIDPENWIKQIDQVQLVAELLIQEVLLAVYRSGKADTSYSKSLKIHEN
jgi:hypothetical protein